MKPGTTSGVDAVTVSSSASNIAEAEPVNSSYCCRMGQRQGLMGAQTARDEFQRLGAT